LPAPRVAEPVDAEPVARPGTVSRGMLAWITAYQRYISPFLGPRCRFYPTCSSYAATALRDHGAVRGLWLSVRRIGRCHPWNRGGYDPVPPRQAAKNPSAKELLASSDGSGTSAVAPTFAVSPSSTSVPTVTSVPTAGVTRC
jgi:uncharacterized protein